MVGAGRRPGPKGGSAPPNPGACAAATAAILKKHCERGQPITVEMPGGTVTVRWLTDGRLLLTGEAEFVFRGEWPEDPEPC